MLMQLAYVCSSVCSLSSETKLVSCFVWQSSYVLTKEVCVAKHVVDWVTWLYRSLEP